MTEDRPASAVTNQSTETVFRVIEALAAAEGPQGVTALAKLIGLPKTRTYRYLRTLVELGYVEQDPRTELYRLTLKLYHLGQLIGDRTDLLYEARPVMMGLRDLTHQTVSISQLEPDGMRVLELIRYESPVQIVTRPGATLAFHASAQGKLALAFGPGWCWQAMRRAGLPPWTARTTTDSRSLEEEVAQVRRQGWAVAAEQILMGVNALAAPVFGQDGVLRATIAIVGSVQFIKPQPEPEQVEAIRTAARTISLKLGWKEKSK